MQHYYILLQYAITSLRELLRITSITTITAHYFPGQLGDVVGYLKWSLAPFFQAVMVKDIELKISIVVIVSP
jgi:hypothetical protein